MVVRFTAAYIMMYFYYTPDYSVYSIYDLSLSML